MNKTNSPTFGSTIKEARLRAGLGRQRAADEAEMSKSLLRFWEIDQVTNPDVEQAAPASVGLDPLPLIALLPGRGDFTDALPGVQPYLRSKYPELPEEALKEIASVVRRYGVDPNSTGPAPGEDE
ncbi:MAG: helix-turn-helix domain-containing protein [Tetrasphaera sp.]|nr:helix-turn-helix domain-containing protein [Tetrasphaera sp.]